MSEVERFIVKPELRAHLRSLLEDGEWHDEKDIIALTALLVDDGVGLRFYERGRKGDALSDPRSTDERIYLGKREYIISVLKRLPARLEVTRRWRRGSAAQLTRSQGLDVSILNVLADRDWHTTTELLDALHIRPEVAVRKYLSFMKNNAKRVQTTNRQEQAIYGSRLYLSQIISRMRLRQGFNIEKRGKRGKGMEFRLGE